MFINFTYPNTGEQSDPILDSIKAWQNGEFGPDTRRADNKPNTNDSNGSSEL